MRFLSRFSFRYATSLVNTTVAELRILGCTAGQGHLISPALEAGDIAPLLSGGQGRAGGPQQT